MNLTASDEVTEKLLHQQKRELAILHAIIRTVSSSDNLKDTLESALEIILSVVNSSVGWICLLDGQSCFAFAGKKGLCFSSDHLESNPCIPMCVCGRVKETRDIVVIHELHKGCPLLVESVDSDQQIIGHVAIPLMAKSRMVGQLNIAFNDKQLADQMDIDLLKTIAPQLAVAVENARLWEDVQEKEELRKELLKKVVGAQEDERQRISRELHDELGQELTSFLVRLQVLEKNNGSSTSKEIITGLKESTTGMLNSIHDLTLQLRPIVLDDLGLAPALSQFVRGCPDHLGINVDLEIMGDECKRLPHDVETTLYRIIQESLTNVARHSGTDNASVVLKCEGPKVIAIIEDRGRGFDLKDVRTKETKGYRLGLYGMEERVALVGGALTIETNPGHGTNIYVEVPVDFSKLAPAQEAQVTSKPA